MEKEQFKEEKDSAKHSLRRQSNKNFFMNANNDFTQLRLWKKHLTEREARLPIILTRKYKIKRILPWRFR